MRQAPHMFCRVFPELWKAIEQGNYLLFKHYYNQPPQPGNPNIIGSIYNRPVINALIAEQNLRIIAELLRYGAELEYIAMDGYPAAFLPHRAVRDQNWPLICLLLYLRGASLTTIHNCEGKTAMEQWIGYGLNEAHPYTAGYRFLEIVNRQKVLTQEGAALETQHLYFEAFKKYDQAASMVLDFHQGDANLVPFYQEEAIEPFFKAVQALIQDFTQAVPATTHLYDTANVKAGKQTHLIFYITSVVLSKLGPIPGLDPRKDKDKMVDPALLTRFTDVIHTWQLPQTPINWSDPLLNDYNPSRPRSYSNDSDKSKDSAVGSAENLAKNTSA